MNQPLATVGQLRGVPAALRARLSGAPARAAVHLSRPTERALHVAIFSLSLLDLAAVLWMVFIRDITPIDFPTKIPWPVFVVGFFVAERLEVSIHFRRERHSFSLSEIPAVIGLFCLVPGEYLVAHLLGSGAALLASGRVPFLKLLFNISHFAVAAVLALGVFYAFGPSGTEIGPREWVAAFAAMLASSVLGAVAVATVITLSGGAPQFQKLPEMLEFGGMAAVANTSVALLAVTILRSQPEALWLLAIPATTVFVAYRAYVSEREKHERLELLYQSSRILQHSPELDSALVDLLEHARTMFRAELAEIVLHAPEQGETLRTTSFIDGEPEAMVTEPWQESDTLWREVAEHTTAFILAPDGPLHVSGKPVRQAMVAPLIGEAGLTGRFVIANRLTEGAPFENDDLRLFETLANQAAVALENGQLERSLTELSRLKEQLNHMAYHDSLTGLANRSLFTDQVEARLVAAAPDHLPVVLFLDLDDFKLVNDTMGHAAGDQLLQLVAQRLTGCLRPEDVSARLGGDEFAVLLSDDPDLTAAMAVGGRILDVLQAPFLVAGQEMLVGASIGIAAAKRADQRADELLRNADVAMYTAKADGKRRIAVFDPTMHAAIVARHEMSGDLARAIVRDQFEVYLQPILDLSSDRTVGFEALLRWRHPTRGIVAPAEFIRLAEETGSILDIGRWILTESCRRIVSWRDRPELGGPFMISVNVSSLQLQQPGFIAEVEHAIADTGIDPSMLVLELTESAMFHDAAATIAKLEQLRERGVRIALDDFGTGYSSLSYLRRFPVDILKIARDFIGPPETRSDEWAFAAAIVALGQTLGLTVIAEGIEEPGQYERLRALGCDLGQGYLFARPADVPTIETMLRRQAVLLARSGGDSAAIRALWGAKLVPTTADRATAAASAAAAS